MATIYTRECSICGVSFESERSYARYCSDECRRNGNRDAARRSFLRHRKERTCKRCGVSLDGKPNRQVYCSDECKRGTRVCEQCGKVFVPTKKSAGRFCSTECFYEKSVPTGSTVDTGDGYKIVKTPSDTPGKKRPGCRARWMLEHRYVMQIKLGRPLDKTERVHHINGIRSDNRPENLELWQHSHPSGVRKLDEIKDAYSKLPKSDKKRFLAWLEEQE